MRKGWLFILLLEKRVVKESTKFILFFFFMGGGGVFHQKYFSTWVLKYFDFQNRVGGYHSSKKYFSHHTFQSSTQLKKLKQIKNQLCMSKNQLTIVAYTIKACTRSGLQTLNFSIETISNFTSRDNWQVLIIKIFS